MRKLAFLVLFALMGCGADAPPTPPEGGIAITGQARIGVSSNVPNP